jgi:hypothetical protein
MGEIDRQTLSIEGFYNENAALQRTTMVVLGLVVVWCEFFFELIITSMYRIPLLLVPSHLRQTRRGWERSHSLVWRNWEIPDSHITYASSLAEFLGMTAWKTVKCQHIHFFLQRLLLMTMTNAQGPSPLFTLSLLVLGALAMIVNHQADMVVVRD